MAYFSSLHSAYWSLVIVINDLIKGLV